ncbi:membrane protein [Streptomyces bicolor]|uniref:membrane protein n=1 Tax=Streptomyces bicolor TaxID=66874 RepID=UPI0004E11DF4|nr:membrane protein [Streptomyces bicolor]
MTGMGVEVGAQAARARALAVLRIRSRALAVALLPAAVAVVLLVGASTGHFVGPGWHAFRWVVTPVAVLVLLAAAGIALVVARARPAVSPTVPIAEEHAPDLYRMVRDLADRLDVPAPSAIALTPDCDSWLEDRTHPSHGPPPTEGRHDDGLNGLHGGSPRGTHRRTPAAPVLVIGSPFLWWMRVGELRAVLAPVVAGTGPSAHPDIAQARRFVQGLDAAVAVASTRGRCPGSRAVCAGIGWVARLLLRSCRDHAAEMERGVATAAAERAQAVDYGLRIVAQEQVGLAYAGWDRLLTRVALPAWRMGRWPSRLDAGVVAALTELSRRDRLAEGFASRLGERPACDLLEEPGVVDEAASLLAARLFHGGPAEPGPDWSPVDWHEYPEEVVDRKWRTDAARLHRVLDALGVRRTPDGPPPETDGPTLSRVLDHLSSPPATGPGPSAAGAPIQPSELAQPSEPLQPSEPVQLSESVEAPNSPRPPKAPKPPKAPYESMAEDLSPEDEDQETERSSALAAGLTAELAREEAATPAEQQTSPASGTTLLDTGALPVFPLQPPRTARELLTDHVTAMVCCAAMDTAGATPGLDWLDGPTLLIDGERAADLTPRVLSLIEDGDPAPLRAWLVESGIRPEKPVRLV